MSQITEPLFSILIANYNNGRYIQNCIKSIFNQTYTKWEIIIVDDGSTDNSIELIQSLSESDSRISFFRNKSNHGCGFTKNKCAKLASGEICAFLDPDDQILPNAIQKMVWIHLQHPNLSIVFSTLYKCDENLKIIEHITPALSEGIVVASQIEKKQISAFASYKNKLYLKTEGIDPRLPKAVDQDLYLKMEELGPVYFYPEPLYLYRIHENGISTTKNVYKAQYWEYLVIYKACIRRGINPEVFFSKKIEQVTNTYKNTIHYKIGFTILRPASFIKRFVNRYFIQ